MYGPLGFLFDLPFGNVTSSSTRTRPRSGSRRARSPRCSAWSGVAATYWAARRLWGVREGLVAAAVLSLRVPAGGLLAGRGDRRGRARPGWRSRCCARCARPTRAAARLRARRRGGRPGASRSSTRPGWCCCRSGSRRSRGCAPTAPRALGGLALGGGARGARVRGAQSLPVRLARPVVDRPARPGRRRRQRSASPGRRRGGLVLLPRQPHLGPRLGRRSRRRSLGAVLVLRRDLVRGLHPDRAARSRCSSTWPSSRATSGAGCCPPTRRWRCWRRSARCARPTARERSRRGGRAAAAAAVAAVLAALTAVVLVQPLAADVRSARVLGREDTLSQARAWLV